MKENIEIDPKDYDLSHRIKINLDTVQYCIDELENFNIKDHHAFYMKCVLERFDKCNAAYIEDFDKSLNALSENLFSADGNFNYAEFKRLLRASTKMTSSIYDRYIDLLYLLNKE